MRVTTIVTRALTHAYGRRRGVEGIDLEVAPGALFGFLGPNGAGKTTTIRLLLGFLRADSGEARIFDRDCWRDSAAIKRDVGYVPGDLRLYGWMNAVEGLALLGRLHGRDLRAAGLGLAERLGLDPVLRVSGMSRGTRQKLGLVLALASDPRLLVLDEPTSALDPLVQDALLSLLRERAREGRTVFFSSHTLDEVERLCDRVAIVRDGRIVEDASLEALRARADRVVRLEFPSDAAASVEVPSFLTVGTRSGRRWEGVLRGPSAALVAWAAPLGLVDLEIGAPDLERIFRGYYA